MYMLAILLVSFASFAAGNIPRSPVKLAILFNGQVWDISGSELWLGSRLQAVPGSLEQRCEACHCWWSICH